MSGKTGVNASLNEEDFNALTEIRNQNADLHSIASVIRFLIHSHTDKTNLIPKVETDRTDFNKWLKDMEG